MSSSQPIAAQERADPASVLGLRPMRDSDIEGVLRVEHAAYQFPWSEGIFRDCLRVGYCCWVGVRGPIVHSFGILQVSGPEAHILNLCVDPLEHGCGHGRQLLRKLVTLAARHDAESVFLEVRPSNPVARHLYDTEGFNEVGLRRGYYPAKGGREDAIIMARDTTQEVG